MSTDLQRTCPSAAMNSLGDMVKLEEGGAVTAKVIDLCSRPSAVARHSFLNQSMNRRVSPISANFCISP